MNKQRLLLVAFIVISLQYVRAQDFTFLNYSDSQGIPVQLVDMSQDQHGNLWMTGLLGQFFSHDGVETVAHSFPDSLFTNNIYRISVDSHNTIWLLTDRGLISFNGGDYELFPSPDHTHINYKSKLLIDANDRIWILDADGVVVRGSSTGLIEFEHPDIASSTFNAIAKDSEGNIWLGDNDGVLYKINKNVNVESVRLVELKGVPITGIDLKDNQMVVTNSRGLFLFKNRILKKFVSLALGESIEKIVIDGSQNIWILFDGQLWKALDNGIIRIDESFGLTNNRIIQIFDDSNGELWVMTDAAGTFRYSCQAFEQFKMPDESIVSSILSLEQNVIFGTYGKGIYKSENSHKVNPKRIITNTDLDQAIILSICEWSDKTLLVATHGHGLYRLKLKANEAHAELLTVPSNIKFIRSMKIFGDSIALATNKGFVLYDGHQWKFFLNDHVINCFHRISAEAFVVGSASGGLFRVQGDQLTELPTKELKSTGINTIINDPSGNYWIGSNRNEILIVNQEFELLSRLTLPMVYSGVYFISFINQNTALIGGGGSSSNVIRITFSPDYTIQSHIIYGPSQGWPNCDFVLGAIGAADHDIIWLGTTVGAFKYKTSVDVNLDLPATPYIRNVSLLNTSLDIDEYSKGRSGIFRLPTRLRLPYYLNNLTIGYRACNFASPRSLLYRFRLKGLEEKWSDWTSRDEVIFSNLSAGEYDFQVQAIQDGRLSELSIPYHFSIRPAFWRTSWFYFLILCSGIILFIAFGRLYSQIKLRDYKMQETIKRTETARIKQQMSMDFHDELGNKLASVISYASTLRSLNVDQELDKTLELIQTNSQEIFHRTKDFIWAIDVESNNLFQVLIYLRDFGVTFFERNGIRMEVMTILEQVSFDKVLPEGYNRQIILIFKEAMTNILKHSKSSLVCFHAYINRENRVRLIIEDNGTGIAELTNSSGGLRNMRKRASGINGAIELDKSDLGGLKVTLEFRIS